MKFIVEVSDEELRKSYSEILARMGYIVQASTLGERDLVDSFKSGLLFESATVQIFGGVVESADTLASNPSA